METIRNNDTLIIPIYLDTEALIGRNTTPTGKRMFENARKTLKLMADESGGLYYQAKKIEDLKSVYDQVIEDLGKVYSLGYKPTNNKHDGTFTRIIAGTIVTDGGSSVGCTWGDYDNDGYLDLFVSNAANERNFLYRNNGDGTFGRILSGNIVTDGGDSIGCVWGDYDNDGFLDLFVANRAGQNNFLYHNDGNSNHWVRVKCVGTVSNRAAIGTKVRIKATVAGAERWQMRQISGGDGENNSDSLMAQFGVGDAFGIETVRVEWPSGAVQEFTNIVANQSLTVIEPPRLTAIKPANGPGFEFNLTGQPGFNYTIEGSTNLTHWMQIFTLTNSGRVSLFADADATNFTRRFYRAVQLEPSLNVTR